MNNGILDEIKKTIIAKLTEKCGYCGVMDGDNLAVLNSGMDPEEFVITIKDKTEDKGAK